MIEISEVNTLVEYEKLVSDNDKVVLKAGATWCGPCRVLVNTLKGLDKDKLNGFIVSEFDVDEDDELTNKLQIRNVPVMFFIINGEIKDKLVGNVTANIIYDKVKTL